MTAHLTWTLNLQPRSWRITGSVGRRAVPWAQFYAAVEFGPFAIALELLR